MCAALRSGLWPASLARRPGVQGSSHAGEGTQCAPGRPFNRASPDEGVPVNKTARVQPLPPCLARRGSWTSSLALWDLATIVSPFSCVIQKSISKTKIRTTLGVPQQTNRFQTTSAAMPLRYRKRHWQTPCRFLQWPASSPSLRPSKSDHGAGATVSPSLSCSRWDRATELISVHCAEKTTTPLRFRPRRQSPPTPSRRP